MIVDCIFYCVTGRFTAQELLVCYQLHIEVDTGAGDDRLEDTEEDVGGEGGRLGERERAGPALSPEPGTRPSWLTG